MSIPEYHCTEGHTIQPKDWEAVEALKSWAAASQRAVETFKSWHANTDKYETVLRLLTEARDLLRTESDCEAFELADKIDAALGSPVDGETNA